MKTFFKVIGIIFLVLLVIGIAISILALLKPLLIICAIVATIYFAYRYYKAGEDDLTIDDKKIIDAEKETYPNLKADIIKQNKNKYIKNAVISAVATLAIALFIPSTAALEEQQQKTEAENQKKQEEIELAREEREKEKEKESDLAKKEEELKKKEEELKNKEEALKEQEEQEEQEEKAGAEKSSDFQAVKVASTVDGDTIEVVLNGSNQRLRLIGVDTPETVHPSKPVEFMGKEASDFTKEQLTDKEIRLEKDVSDTDRYQRLLRYIWLEDPSDIKEPTYEDIRDKTFNGILLREGYAKASTYPPDVKYQEFFSKIEQEAREAKKGLWNEEAAANFDGSPAEAETPPGEQPQESAESQETASHGLIKGNSNSMIYHVPGGASYDKVAEHNAVYFDTEEEAQAAGYRRAKR